MSSYEQVQEAAKAISERAGGRPDVAIVLGSGLGDFAGRLAAPISLPYGQLPHWPAARVIGHEGRLVVGTLQGRRVAALAGRCHAYEGHDLPTVVFAVRAIGLLGVKTLILTNAAGGVNTGFSPRPVVWAEADDTANTLTSASFSNTRMIKFLPTTIGSRLKPTLRNSNT